MRSWMLDALLAPAAVCPEALRGALARVYLSGLDWTIPKWRQTARRNLHSGGIPQPELIIRRNKAHLQRVIETLLWQHHLDRRWLATMLRVEGAGNLPAGRGRGRIFVSTHLGNWELGALAKGIMDKPVMLPVRRTGIVAVDAELDRRRGATGNQVIDRLGASASMLRRLSQGGDVGMLIDTRPDDEAHVEVRFLGLRGWAGTTAARLRLLSGADVICGHTLWDEAEQRYVLHYHPAPAMRGEVESDTKALLQHFEGIIRQHPEQYLWIHDRWSKPSRTARRQSACEAS